MYETKGMNIGQHESLCYQNKKIADIIAKFFWFVISDSLFFNQRIFFNQCYALNILEIKFSLVVSYGTCRKKLSIPFNADIHITRQTSFTKNKAAFYANCMHYRSQIVKHSVHLE